MTNKSSYEELEDALRENEECCESEECYQSIIDKFRLGISVVNPNMEILCLNKQMRDRLPEIDIYKKPVCYKTFNTPPRQEICIDCPTIKAIEDGTPHESFTSTGFGDIFISYRIIATPIKNKEGEVVRIINMIEDVTERIKVEKILKNNANTLQSIFRAAPVGIGLVKDRILIKVNDRLCKITGSVVNRRPEINRHFTFL